VNINPQISVNPNSGPFSTTIFRVSGTGFTPVGQVIEHLTGKPPTTRFTDSGGNFSVQINVASPATYTLSYDDVSSGKSSNTVTFIATQ
jgi:hypothetical protein